MSRDNLVALTLMVMEKEILMNLDPDYVINKVAEQRKFLLLVTWVKERHLY